MRFVNKKLILRNDDLLILCSWTILTINRIDAGYLLTLINVNKLCLFFSVKVNKVWTNFVYISQEYYVSKVNKQLIFYTYLEFFSEVFSDYGHFPIVQYWEFVGLHGAEVAFEDEAIPTNKNHKCVTLLSIVPKSVFNFE